MRRLFIIAVILLLPVSMLTAVDPLRVSGRTNDSGLRVRSGPELGDEVVGSLPFDINIEILDISDEKTDIGDMSARWYRIRNLWNGDEIEGWAYGYFIDVNPNNLLAKAIWLNRTELIKDLIIEGADINADLIEEGEDFTQYELYSYVSSALMEAVKASNADIVTILLDAGADIDARMILGGPGGSLSRSPLIQAVESGNIEISELLISRGADLESTEMNFGGGTGKQEITPLSVAVTVDNRQMVEILLSAGADVNHAVNYQQIQDTKKPGTPVDIAAEMGLTEMEDILREYGGEPGN